jgi:TrmH family RNA methyltransferase
VLKNTGLARLVLVNPCAWDTPEARWLAHGAEDILAASQVFPDLASAVASEHLVIGATHRLGRFRDVNSHPRQALAEVAAQAHEHRVAVVFGREKDGLWRRELQLCHQLIRFPTAVKYPSLNLSHAVLVFAYELFHAVRVTRAAPSLRLATAEEREHLYRHLGAALTAIEFKPFNDDPGNFDRVLRRFFNRAPLERRDAMVIHKICSQIEKYAARHAPRPGDPSGVTASGRTTPGRDPASPP